MPLQYQVSYFDQGAICIYVACIKIRRKVENQKVVILRIEKYRVTYERCVEESKLVTSIKRTITHLLRSQGCDFKVLGTAIVVVQGEGRVYGSFLSRGCSDQVGRAAGGVNQFGCFCLGTDPPVMHMILATSLPLTSKPKDQRSKMTKK
jgi:hypothetical protein